MKSYGKQFQFQLTEEAERLVLTKLENKSVDGNGRFATNLMNEAIQAQALRLMTACVYSLHIGIKLPSSKR